MGGRIGSDVTVRPVRRAIAAAALLCCLAPLGSACSASSDDPQVLSADEDRQLNDAAAKLDGATANESSAP